MRTLMVFAGLLLATAPAWAGSYTVTTSAAQDRALAARAQHAGVTVDELVRAHVLNGLVNPTLAEQQQARERVYREALDALAPAARARVLQDLGVRE